MPMHRREMCDVATKPIWDLWIPFEPSGSIRSGGTDGWLIDASRQYISAKSKSC